MKMGLIALEATPPYEENENLHHQPKHRSITNHVTVFLAWAVLFGARPSSASPVAPASPDPESRVSAALAGIERGLRSTKYTHRAKIDREKGVYEWDCSIMTAWILERAAPAARKALATDKPLARDFFRVIAAAGTNQPRNGWQRVDGPASVAPGDVFAWLKPAIFKDRANTGHVGFVMSKPWPHPRLPSVWLVRIADSTRELHGDDSRPVGGEGGFGTATIGFYFDDGTPIAYGWYGEPQEPDTYVPTKIVFGRAVR